MQRVGYSLLRAWRGTAHDVRCLATQPCHQLTPFYQSRLTQTQLIISPHAAVNAEHLLPRYNSTPKLLRWQILHLVNTFFVVIFVITDLSVKKTLFWKLVFKNFHIRIVDHIIFKLSVITHINAVPLETPSKRRVDVTGISRFSLWLIDDTLNVIQLCRLIESVSHTQKTRTRSITIN